jgi:hypothetical protein
VALALEAEQLDKRLLAIRNRFDPLNESGLFSIADVASVSTLATRPPRRCPRHTSRSVCDMQTANDLVARLRSPSSDEAALALEAADEIERLRHQIEIFGAWRTRDIEQAAEIRRLCTALRKACEGFAVHGDQPPAEWLALIGAADVASESTPYGDKA